MLDSNLIDSSIATKLQEINRASYSQKWNIIPVNNLPPGVQNTAHRLNALGDNFYFIKIILRKRRLSNIFHRQYCNQFLCWQLKEVNEVPRDHFKTTIGSIGMPIWWALPFNDRDEKLMRGLGYGDEWIDWMKRVHDQNTRTLGRQVRKSPTSINTTSSFVNSFQKFFQTQIVNGQQIQ